MNDDNAPTVSGYCNTSIGQWVKVVRAMVREIDYGEVQLSIHRGRVVEVRKVEKIRFEESGVQKCAETGASQQVARILH